jgi:hypothetical protein
VPIPLQHHGGAEASFGLQFWQNNCSKFAFSSMQKLCDMTQLSHQNNAAHQKTLHSLNMKDTTQRSSIGWFHNACRSQLWLAIWAKLHTKVTFSSTQKAM